MRWSDCGDAQAGLLLWCSQTPKTAFLASRPIWRLFHGCDLSNDTPSSSPSPQVEMVVSWVFHLSVATPRDNAYRCLSQNGLSNATPRSWCYHTSPSFLWCFSGFSLFWYLSLLSGKYKNMEKPLKHQRRLGLTVPGQLTKPYGHKTFYKEVGHQPDSLPSALSI